MVVADVRRKLADKVQVSEMTRRALVRFLAECKSDRAMINENTENTSFEHVPEPFDCGVRGEKLPVIEAPVSLGWS